MRSACSLRRQRGIHTAEKRSETSCTPQPAGILTKRGNNALRSDSEQPRHAFGRTTHCRAAHVAARTAACTSEDVRGTLPGDHPEPSGIHRVKPAPNLNTDDHQAATASAHELGVGLVAFAPGAVNSSTGVHVSTRLGITRARHGADDCGINSLLCAMPHGQPVRDNFDAAVIGDRNIDVHDVHASTRRTLRATRAPASWHTLATACSRGRARDASTPKVTHAALWVAEWATTTSSTCPMAHECPGPGANCDRRMSARFKPEEMSSWRSRRCAKLI